MKMTAGSEMEMVGVTGKSKETAGSEAETVAGMESGVDIEVGMDLESRVDRSEAVAGAEASVRCAIADRKASCRESEGKAKIEGYMSISDEEAHHPLSTEIVTVLSHIATRES